MRHGLRDSFAIKSIESAVLQPRVDDSELGVNYWEVFDRRRKLRRLQDEAAGGYKNLPADARTELARQILVQVKMLHDIGAAHLDIGAHSVWMELPTTVRLSHLMAATFPEIQTLGERRYQFLSSVQVPERVFDVASAPQVRDVYLVGTVVHLLCFGCLPACTSRDLPGEWNDAVDQARIWMHLYPWFARALDLSPEQRFANAAEMLAEFNKACSTEKGPAAIIAGLERFRTIASQRLLYKEYEEVREVQDTQRVFACVADHHGSRVILKVWKREGWGDQAKECPRILDFLERAQVLIEQPVAGFAPIRSAYWLGDAIALAQHYADGIALDKALSDASGFAPTVTARVTFLRVLIDDLEAAHQRQIAHGDLKPSNIVVVGADDPRPVLIDYLDFAPESDGERVTSAYSPMTGGRLERDRFALCKIIEECLAGVPVGDVFRAGVDAALQQVRSGPPPNASLEPLIDALAVSPEQAATACRTLRIGSASGGTGRLMSDEGTITLRLAPHGRVLFVRGACEQLIVTLTEVGKPKSFRRAQLDQKRIGAGARFEVSVSPCELEVYSSPIDSFTELESLLDDPAIKEQLSKKGSVPSSQAVAGEAAISEVDVGISADVDDDEEIEQVRDAPTNLPARPVDVALLWKQSINIESELSIEAVATGDSAYQALIRRHVVPFQMEVGEFEFDKDDTVMVSRFDGGGRWTKIGIADISGTRSGFLQIDSVRTAFRPSDQLVAEGGRLRFSSHFEETSRSRRRSALERILNGQSRVPDLIKIFCGEQDAPRDDQPIELNTESLRETYGFNDSQLEAFAVAVRSRPLSLLQGPPGTGKTRFIGALIHYALKSGLARNVLVASQSHEAVNGAAESILKWFDSSSVPSVLRVGHEGNVSEQLIPYHVGKVEALLKDRLRGEFSERVGRVGEGMGLPAALCADIIYLETVAAPVARRIASLSAKKADDPARYAGVIDTMRTITSRFQSDLDPENAVYVGELCQEVARKTGFVNAMLVDKFRDVVHVAEDFINSVSTRNRSFESFLAGTRQVVAGTCVGLGRTALGLVSTSFDLVIIDEAARCTAGELAVSMQAGRWVVLVGDHHQLEPMLKKRMLDALSNRSGLPQAEVLKSDFERVFERPESSKFRRTLTTQYRMLPAIGEMVSDAFYKVGLEHGRTDPIIPSEKLPPFLSHPVTWLATDEFESDGHQSTPKHRPKSFENVREAELIVDAIRAWDRHEPFREWLELQNSLSHVVGIICTYAAQADLVRRKLRASYVSDVMRQAIKIDTVDSYQGKENPIVLLSLVRNNVDGAKENGEPTIAPGFMYRPNRINVAISRAMDRLVIVGAVNRWSSRGPMGEVVKAFDRQKNLGTARIESGIEFRGLSVAAVNEKRKKKGGSKGGPK